MIYLIPVNELTDFDYDILEKVAQHSIIDEIELVEAFPEQVAVKLRIEKLLQPDVESGVPFPIEGTAYLERDYIMKQGCGIYTGKIQITPLGLKTLEDWHLHKKKDRRKLLEWRISKYAPIIISIVALIVATISLLQSLHWIDLEKSVILSTLHNYMDSPSSTSESLATQPTQSP